jgi:uncharacterized BrkB/YihY/UPF0761 family membrane protein
MLIGGVLLASILANKMTINAPFCQAHRNHWLMRTLVIVFGFIGVFVVSGALLFVVAAKSAAQGADDKPMLIALGFGGVLLLAWLVMVVVLQYSAIRAKEVTEKSMTLTGVSPSFISALRDLRGERRTGADERKLAARRRALAEEEDDSDEDEDD